MSLAAVLAAPVLEEKKFVPILKHINQLNPDGSYTFGYESGDGSFRVETKDLSGHVKGKYGYIDVNGQARVVEYTSGKNTGFQATGAHIPVPLVPVTLPVRAPVAPLSFSDQKTLDLEYSSVDDDEDGIPDKAPGAVKVAPAPAPAPVAIVAPAPAPAPVVPARAPAQFIQVVSPGQGAFPGSFFQFGDLSRLSPVRVVQFPFGQTVTTNGQLNQLIQDLQFQSVDANEDGIPDSTLPVSPLGLPVISPGQFQSIRLI